MLILSIVVIAGVLIIITLTSMAIAITKQGQATGKNSLKKDD
jgi:hypothetical protein